jgi:hypothetical protein
MKVFRKFEFTNMVTVSNFRAIVDNRKVLSTFTNGNDAQKSMAEVYN